VPTFHNNGVILGLFSAYSFYLVLIGFIFLLQVLVKNHFSSASALILGGALSNLADRLRFGYVVDYIDLKYLPVFNIADIAIVLGAIFLVYSLLKKEKKYG
jgi:signal peptidase II